MKMLGSLFLDISLTIQLKKTHHANVALSSSKKSKHYSLSTKYMAVEMPYTYNLTVSGQNIPAMQYEVYLSWFI